MHIIIDAKNKKVINYFHDSQIAEARNYLLKVNRKGNKYWMVYVTNEEYLNYIKTLDKR